MDRLGDVLERIRRRLEAERPAVVVTSPTCPLGMCDGSGWILERVDGHEVARECEHVVVERRRAQVRRLFAAARIPARFREATLATFDRTRQPRAWAVARAYVDRWEEVRRDGRWLYLWGGVGTGKSHLAYGILHELLERGVAGMAVTVPDLMDELRPGRGDEAERLRVLRDVDLLVLDDLGAERDTAWVTERLYMLLHGRWADSRPTVITSNLGLEELERVPGWDRIVDRIVDAARIVRMEGESYRLERARARRVAGGGSGAA